VTTSGQPPSEGAGPARFEPDAFGEFLPEFSLRRLPVGRHSLPRSFVARHQRLRILAAMLRVLPKYGYTAVTIGHLTTEAGVSRAAFYKNFESKEDCFLATYDLASQWLCERVERAAGEDEEWPTRVRAGTSEALTLLAANPRLARLFAIEALQAGPAARERQQTFLARFAEALRAGRSRPDELPTELEEMLLGGVVATIGRYVDGGQIAQLPEATVELVQYLLLPYLDPDETRRVARAA
jgi:AcrR family transcriptional regulator